LRENKRAAALLKRYVARFACSDSSQRSCSIKMRVAALRYA